MVVPLGREVVAVGKSHSSSASFNHRRHKEKYTERTEKCQVRLLEF